MTQEIYNAAAAYLGMEEYPGAKHNQQILDDFAASGHSWVKDDETPWCAAFVGARLAECGIAGTGKLNARSYLNWGEEVPLEYSKPGDVVVFWRKDRNGPYGHVAFLDHVDGEKVHVLGGNQGDAVSIAAYPLERLLSVRAAPGPKRERASKIQSKTLQSTVIAGAGAGATGLTAIASLDGTAQIVAIAGLIATVIALAVIFKERLRKWAEGDR